MCFIHLLNNVNNWWITSNFPLRWHRTTSTTSGWKSLIFNRNSSGERWLKFTARGENDNNKKPRAKRREHRIEQQRQRCQHSDDKHVQRQQKNTPITLQMEPMKGGNTDCWRFKKWWGDQATLTSTVYSKNNYLLWCNDRQQQLHDPYNAHQEYLSDGLRTAYQPLHHEQHLFYGKLYFTMNSL